MNTCRVIDHEAENDHGAVGGGGAKTTVRELIRQLQTLPGDYALWVDWSEEGITATAPVWYVDVGHDNKEVSFG